MHQMQLATLAPAGSGNVHETLARRLESPRIIESKDLLRPTPPEHLLAEVLGPGNVPPGDPAEIRAGLPAHHRQALARREGNEQQAIGRQQAFLQVAQPPNGYAHIELYAGSPAHIAAAPQVIVQRLQELFGPAGNFRHVLNWTDRAELIVRAIRGCPPQSEALRRLAIQGVDPHVKALPRELCKAVAQQLLPEAQARQSEALGLACLEWIEHCELEDGALLLRFAGNLEKTFGASFGVFRRLVNMAEVLPTKEREAGRLRLASIASHVTDCNAAALALLENIEDDAPAIQLSILKDLTEAGVARVHHADPQKRITPQAWMSAWQTIWERAGRLPEPHRAEAYAFLGQFLAQ